MSEKLPSHADSPPSPIRARSTIVPVFSNAPQERDKPYPDWTAPGAGASDDHAADFLTPGQWPRVFPGL